MDWKSWALVKWGAPVAELDVAGAGADLPDALADAGVDGGAAADIGGAAPNIRAPRPGKRPANPILAPSQHPIQSCDMEMSQEVDVNVLGSSTWTTSTS